MDLIDTTLKGKLDRVTICHKGKTITVNSNALKAHLNHGDVQGDNGVTIKCYDWGNVGDTCEINGITYTIVDGTMLRLMIENLEDVTKVCTTKVTNMIVMFDFSGLNQDISSWDVSNVTNMLGMFSYSAFNQDISIWDVSNVTNMSEMFRSSPFNQDIGSWDVSNVTNMTFMFAEDGGEPPFINSPFNQDISSWDVSNVSNMQGMFLNSSFNQDISNWNVTNVTECNSFSGNTPQGIFPKPIFTNCTE